MATIEKRGPHQFRARIRRKNQTLSRTFETKSEAVDWAAQEEGKIRGDEYINRKRARNTTLKEAIEWFLDDIAPRNKEDKRIARTKHVHNQISHAKYWLETPLASYSLISIRSGDLIGWRKRVLDEANREEGEDVGEDAEFGPQAAIHKLNFISILYNSWSSRFQTPLENPVGRNVRPKLPLPRNRRLDKGEESRLLAACRKKNQQWLVPLVELAIETAMRKGELLKLQWSDVGPDTVLVRKPKNKDDRTVPLSTRARAIMKHLRKRAQADLTPGQLLSGTVFPSLTGDTVSHVFAEACAAATPTIEDLHFHDLRHEATSRLFERTPLRDLEIAMITGHKSPEMLRRYSHLSAQKFVAKIP